MKEKQKVGLVGIGLMGSSIATCLLAAGHPVTAFTLEIEKAEETKSRIGEMLSQLKSEGMLKEAPQQLLKRLIITDSYRLFDQHDLVLESIFENVAKKKEVFKNLENVLSREAVIGTNTSALPVSLLQEGMKYPGRLLGIHWGEPAHISRFMEIICGHASEPGAAEKIFTLAETWGKEPSLLRKDIRGFITNRLMYALMREGMHLVENGYASIEDIDRACRNDMGFWMTFAGPFRFMDLTGIPAYLSVMKELFKDLNNSPTPPAFVEKLVASGAKGISNASGFYPYTEASAEKWRQLFVDFSYDIKKISEKYPKNAGDL